MAELYQVVSASDQNLAIPNPNLKPEKVLSEEIAVERRFVNGKVRLSLFNENVHDALIAQLTQLADGTERTTSSTQCRGGAQYRDRTRCAEEQCTDDGLETFGSVTYVDSRICADPSFVEHDRWNHGGGQAHAQYSGVAPDGRSDLPARRLLVVYRRAAPQQQQLSTLDNTDTVRNVFQAFDPFTVVDLRAQYRFSETATANFGIDNVGNPKYALFHPFPQRTYVADVRIKF